MRTLMASGASALAVEAVGGDGGSIALQVALVHLYNAELSDKTHDVGETDNPYENETVYNETKKMGKSVNEYCKSTLAGSCSFKGVDVIGPLSADEAQKKYIEYRNNKALVDAYGTIASRIKAVPPIQYSGRAIKTLNKIMNHGYLRPMNGDIVVLGVGVPMDWGYPFLRAVIIRRG